MKEENTDLLLESEKEEIMQVFNQPDGRDSVDVESTTGNQTGVSGGDDLRENIIASLKTIYDPEIPVNIYDLGLIYEIRIEQGTVDIDMTLTSPGCPVAATFPGMVEESVKLVPGVKSASVDLVWDPPWTIDLLSEETKLELGLL